MKTIESQTVRIKKHLESGKTISPLRALDMFGCFRLASRIDELRKEGMNIITEMQYVGDVKFARYKLIKNPKSIKA